MSSVVGIGLSSEATTDEVARLLSRLLEDAELSLADVDAIATRQRFVDDVRLALGPPIVGFDDDVLIAASAPVARTIGIPARVAETAASLFVGSDVDQHWAMARSAHVTAALVTTADRP
jgi:cobalamin biosynthesis protein CbiG